MANFGWSYPPGAANDPNAPYNQEDGACDICGNPVDSCLCPECPVCGAYGDPICYEDHGLMMSIEQEHQKAQADRIAREEAEADARYAAEWEAEKKVEKSHENC